MSQAIKVGIFATVCLVVLAVFILRVEDLSLFGEERERVAAEFRDVAGLDDQAAVRVAGVRVGRVDG
ncbi:MAG: MlaD family protein, partial [Thermoanaerobaculia bacterium]